MGKKSKEPQRNNLLNYFSKGNAPLPKRTATDDDIQFVCEVEVKKVFTKIVSEDARVQMGVSVENIVGVEHSENFGESDTREDIQSRTDILNCLQIEIEADTNIVASASESLSQVCKVELFSQTTPGSQESGSNLAERPTVDPVAAGFSSEANDLSDGASRILGRNKEGVGFVTSEVTPTNWKPALATTRTRSGLSSSLTHQNGVNRKEAKRSTSTSEEVECLGSIRDLLHTPVRDCPAYALSPSIQRNLNRFKSLTKSTPNKILPDLQEFLSDHKVQTALNRRHSGFSPVGYVATPPRRQDEKRSPGSEKRNLFGTPEKAAELVPLKRRYEVPYYLQNFTGLIETVISDDFFSGIFNNDDLSYFETFKRLSREAKMVYVRLFNRSQTWKRQSAVKYTDEIDDDRMPEILEELVATDLLLNVHHLMELEPALRLLQGPELEKLCKEMQMKVNSKEQRVEAILTHCRTLKPLFGSSANLTNKIVDKCRKIIVSCYKVAPEPRSAFCRMLAAATMHSTNIEEDELGKQQLFYNMLMVMTGKVVYPRYQIRRQTRVFRDREDLVRYTQALKICDAIGKACEKKDYTQVLSVTEDSVAEFEQDLLDAPKVSFDSSLPLHLRRYVSTSVTAYNLWKRVEGFEKLKQYGDAVALMEKLLSQDVYIPHYRGKIYERLALDCQTHLKDHAKLTKILATSLKDPWVSPSHKYALEQRILRLSKNKKNPLLVELSIDILELESFEEVTLVGERIENEIGSKSTFIRESGGEKTFCSVEEFVVEHYRENGFPYGRHAEGSTFISLFALAFWDLIYDLEVPDAFLGLHQHAPLDLDSTFYQNRKDHVDRRFDLLRKEGEERLMRRFEEVWTNNQGTRSLVNWELLRNPDFAVGLVLSLGIPTFLGICDRLVRNYRVWRSGFPDCVVWNPDTQDHLIIEVKGPNDRLSPKQILWLDYLKSINAKAIVCWVKDANTNLGGNRKRKSSISTPQKEKKLSLDAPKTDRSSKKRKNVDKPSLPSTPKTPRATRLRTSRKEAKQASEPGTSTLGATDPPSTGIPDSLIPSGSETPRKRGRRKGAGKLPLNLSSDSDFE